LAVVAAAQLQRKGTIAYIVAFELVFVAGAGADGIADAACSVVAFPQNLSGFRLTDGASAVKLIAAMMHVRHMAARPVEVLCVKAGGTVVGVDRSIGGCPVRHLAEARPGIRRKISQGVTEECSSLITLLLWGGEVLDRIVAGVPAPDGRANDLYLRECQSGQERNRKQDEMGAKTRTRQLTTGGSHLVLQLIQGSHISVTTT
jgi:hypothetical protein